jgi:hypothetical protein
MAATATEPIIAREDFLPRRSQRLSLRRILPLPPPHFQCPLLIKELWHDETFTVHGKTSLACPTFTDCLPRHSPNIKDFEVCVKLHNPTIFGCAISDVHIIIDTHSQRLPRIIRTTPPTRSKFSLPQYFSQLRHDIRTYSFYPEKKSTSTRFLAPGDTKTLVFYMNSMSEATFTWHFVFEIVINGHISLLETIPITQTFCMHPRSKR